MPKVTYEHLEQVRKALVNSKKALNSEPVDNEKALKAIAQNEKAIEMLDEEYLAIKS